MKVKPLIFIVIINIICLSLLYFESEYVFLGIGKMGVWIIPVISNIMLLRELMLNRKK